MKLSDLPQSTAPLFGGVEVIADPVMVPAGRAYLFAADGRLVVRALDDEITEIVRVAASPRDAVWGFFGGGAIRVVECEASRSAMAIRVVE